jgi:hypothetical protein
MEQVDVAATAVINAGVIGEQAEPFSSDEMGRVRQQHLDPRANLSEGRSRGARTAKPKRY